jgi:hypothetical protein
MPVYAPNFQESGEFLIALEARVIGLGHIQA